MGSKAIACGVPIRYSKRRNMGKRPLMVTGVGCLIGMGLGLCYAAHLHAVGEEGKPVLWSWALVDYLAFWVGWGLVSGPVAWLVYRFPIAPHRKRNALVHVAASAAISPLHSLFCYAMMWMAVHALGMAPTWVHKMDLTQMVLLMYPRGMVYTLLIVAIVHALDYHRQYEERSVAASQLEAQLAQAKLHLLKMQLHPHFLFNTLNSISALLHEDVELADLMIERLGDFLRLTLDHSASQEVTLRQEMEFLNCYLAIEQIRLQDRLIKVIEVDPQTMDARVPGLILQPIVENAIRHSIAPRPAGGKIEISARRERTRLMMTVRDNGAGLAPQPNGSNGKGMGLSITRARLERLYGADHRFELSNAPEGGLIVTLEIPFDTSIPEQVPNDSHPDRG